VSVKDRVLNLRAAQAALKNPPSDIMNNDEDDIQFRFCLDEFVEIESGAIKFIVESCARIKSKHGLSRLCLNGIGNLSIETAQILNKWNGGIHLSGIKEVSAEVAQELATGHQGDLRLNGLTALAPQTLSELIKNEGSIYINGISDLPDEAFVLFAKAYNSLSLNGISSLTAGQAKHLAASGLGKGYVPSLYLEGVSSIDESTAKALAKYKGDLYLGITDLSEAIASALSVHKGNLLSLAEISGEVSDKAKDFLRRHRCVTPNIDWL
jgi:hypothetical protein